MGLGDCCGTATRCMLVVINIPIFVAGLCLLIAGGVFMANDKLDFYPELEQYSENVDSILIPLMVLGAIFLVIGMLGCVGGWSEKDWLLKPYFFLVFIIVIAQIALIIAGVVTKDKVKSKAEEVAADLFDKYKAKYVTEDGTVMPDIQALSVNTLQNVIGCCGLVDGSSWWKTDTVTKYPPGCCSDWDAKNWDASGQDNVVLVDSCSGMGELYTKGCTEQITSLLNEFGVVIIGVIAVIIVFQVLCLAAACYVWKRGDAANDSA